VEAKTESEGAAPVETPVVEAEAKPTVDALTAQLSDSAIRLTASEAQVVALTKERDDAKTALTAVQAEVAELRTQKEAADKARVNAEAKLAAIVAGQPPVTAASAETEKPGSWMERARKSKKE
jgi:chromosome segregation ATPase